MERPQNSLARTAGTALEVPKEWIELERIAAESALSNFQDGAVGQFAQAFKLAHGIRALQTAITDDMMQVIMQLEGTSLGFRTDRDTYEEKDRYPLQVVKSCFIEATLLGLPPVGNHWNIISGRVYVTREGFTKKLHDVPGLTDLEVNIGVPRVGPNGAIVACNASWNFNTTGNGKQGFTLKAEIPIKIYDKERQKGVNVDGLVGKADRKMMARIWKKLTGSELSEGDARDIVDINAEPLTAVAAPAAATTEAPKAPPERVGQDKVTVIDSPNTNVTDIGDLPPDKPVKRPFGGGGITVLDTSSQNAQQPAPVEAPATTPPKGGRRTSKTSELGDKLAAAAPAPTNPPKETAKEPDGFPMPLDAATEAPYRLKHRIPGTQPLTYGQQKELLAEIDAAKAVVASMSQGPKKEVEPERPTAKPTAVDPDEDSTSIPRNWPLDKVVQYMLEDHPPQLSREEAGIRAMKFLNEMALGAHEAGGWDRLTHGQKVRSWRDILTNGFHWG